MLFEFHQSFLLPRELNTNISLYMLDTFMSQVLLVVHKNESFVFSMDTQQGNIQDDDVFFN